MSFARFLFLALLLLAPRAVPAAALDGFDDLERSLRLNPAQKEQYEAAVGATKRAVLGVGLAAWQLKDRLGAELQKPRPDLGELARAQDELVEQTRPLFVEARGEWKRLYAMLDPDQVAATRAFVEDRMRRLEGFGEAVKDLLAEKLRER